MNLFRTIHASAHATGLPDASVQCIVTSPPYWGLRKYAGEQGVEWPAVDYAPMPGLPEIHVSGCDPDCDHEWADGPTKTQAKQRDNNPDGNTPGAWFGSTRGENESRTGQSFSVTQGAYCRKCGGWRGGLGLEPTPEAYIGHMVLVMREMRRVLRDDGVAFVNLGDSYNGSGKGQMGDGEASDRRGAKQATSLGTLSGGLPTGISHGLKPKDLIGIPFRFAFAAQADGWWLRSDIIWAKPNPMPESVTDRPTKSHEYVFLLTKSAKYYYDADAVREDQQESSLKRLERGWNGNGDRGYPHGPQNHFKKYMGKTPEEIAALPGRNLRDVWTLATQPTPYAHFATYPEALAEKCILAGTSARGACPTCGAPWQRVVERTAMVIDRSNNHPPELRTRTSGTMVQPPTSETTGWQPTCACFGEFADSAVTQKCVVLDPFHGSGTTGVVALRLGRAYIGVDISEEYLHGVTAERMGAGVQVGLGI